MEYCLEIAEARAYMNENLESIPATVQEQKERLRKLYAQFEEVQCAAATT